MAEPAAEDNNDQAASAILDPAAPQSPPSLHDSEFQRSPSPSGYGPLSSRTRFHPGSSNASSGSGSWSRDHSSNKSSRGDPPPPPRRISSTCSSRSISPDLGVVPAPPPPPGQPNNVIPPPLPPSGYRAWSRSPSPSTYTIPPPPPSVTPPPPHPIEWRPPNSAIAPFTNDPQPEPSLGDRRRIVDDATARIMLFLLDNNRANHSSDYAYSLSLFPFFNDMEPGPEYSYPDDLSKCPIFVDRIGWLPSDEVCRYLMMGYRVWDENGRRLHLSGLPFGFDGLKAPIRYEAKTICTQDPRQVPDLHWQLRKGDLSRPRDDEEFENPMPWDIRLGVPDFSQEGTNLQLVQRAWIQNRFENATPCYFQGDCFRYEHLGGWKVDVSPLKEIPYDERSEWIVGPYARIGADFQCLTTMYPPTKVTLEGNTGEPKLCELCSSLDFKDLFEWGLADVEVDFGMTDELVARMDCDFCRILATLCEDGLDHLRRGAQPNSTSVRESSGYRFDLNQPLQALFVRDPGHCLTTKPCLVLKQDYRREYLGPIVSLRTVRGEIRGNLSLEDRRFVHFDLLKRVIGKCASTHEECKREGRDDEEMILIDVSQMCLVQVKSVQYITLSYVWGNKPIFKTTKSNFESLQVPGSLDGVSILTRGVAAVVKGLDIQYLWIDALCIIQDDESHKRTQISRMADIYGQSCLTIVALTGTSSEFPLPGISIPRPQTLAVVHDMPFTFHLSGLTQTAHDQVYETRGWTFQERLISRRCLYFADRQIHFECRHSCTSDHEQIFPESDRGRYATPLNPLQPLHSLDKVGKFSLTALETFTSVVCQYTSRTLSFPSDIENAFLGIQAFMSRKLSWSFIAALPTGVFDWALLWLPRGHLKRRAWRDKDGKEIKPPSWSWLGWEGQVSYGFYDYLHKPFFLRIRPRTHDFTLLVEEQKIQIHREPSDLWHDDVAKDSLQLNESDQSTPISNISFTHSPTLYLQFTAEFIPSHHPSISAPTHHPPPPPPPNHQTTHPKPPAPLLPSSIEWLTTGSSNGMLRPGLRFDYNSTIETLASTYDPDRLAIIAIAGADVQITVQGGQFGEDKVFEEGGRAVVMLVVRGEGDGSEDYDGVEDEKKEDEEEGEGEVWERLAIGYLSIESWDAMKPERKTFRLG